MMAQLPAVPTPTLQTLDAGPALARTPAWVRRSGRGLAILGAGGLVALAVVPWQQTAFATGKVVVWDPSGRTQAVESPITGRVEMWRVREGDVVRAGDPLVDLGDNDPQFLDRLREERDSILAQRAASERRIDELETRRDALRTGRDRAAEAAALRVTAERDRVTAAQQTWMADQATAEATTANIRRTQSLAAEGLRSQRDLELADAAARAADAAVARSDAQRRVADSQLAAAVADRDAAIWRADADIASVDAEIENAMVNLESVDQRILQLDARISRQENQAVVAPFDGVVARVQGGQGGEQVREGDRLLEVVPLTQDRAVEVSFLGVDAPLIGVGQEVRLQFEGWPALQIAGWPQVAAGTFAGRVSFVDAAADAKGQVRAIVTPIDPASWPDPARLRQGAKTKAWTLLSQVPLGYEVWRQLNGFPASLDAPPTTASDDPAKRPEAGKAWKPK